MSHAERMTLDSRKEESSLARVLCKISQTYDLQNPLVDGPINGWSHDVYVLQYPSGELWSLRVQKPNGDVYVRDYSQSLQILKEIKAICPTLEVPAVIHVDVTWMVMEYLIGQPIGSWTFESNKRHSILDGLAEFYVKLWSCRPATATAMQTSYKEWLTREVDLAIARSLRNQGWEDPIHFLHRRRMIKEIIPPFVNSGPLVRHGDVNALNVIVKDDKLSGVIDWDTAQWVPAPAAIHHPLFIADVPGWFEETSDSVILEADRYYLENAVRKLAGSSSCVADLLSTSRERLIFEMSLRNKRINREFINTRLANKAFDNAAALFELDQYSTSEVASESGPALLDLRNRLLSGSCWREG